MFLVKKKNIKFHFVKLTIYMETVESDLSIGSQLPNEKPPFNKKQISE